MNEWNIQVAQTVTLQARNVEMFGSNFGRGYPEILVFFLSQSRKMLGKYLRLGHDHILPHIFSTLYDNTHSTTGPCIA
jgi:hypothetical protein